MKQLRQQFTIEWDLLPSKVKSGIISVGGFLIATALIKIASLLYPEADFSPLQYLALASFSGFLSSFIKDTIKV